MEKMEYRYILYAWTFFLCANVARAGELEEMKDFCKESLTSGFCNALSLPEYPGCRGISITTRSSKGDILRALVYRYNCIARLTALSPKQVTIAITIFDAALGEHNHGDRLVDRLQSYVSKNIPNVKSSVSVDGILQIDLAVPPTAQRMERDYDNESSEGPQELEFRSRVNAMYRRLFSSIAAQFPELKNLNRKRLSKRDRWYDVLELNPILWAVLTNALLVLFTIMMAGSIQLHAWMYTALISGVLLFSFPPSIISNAFCCRKIIGICRGLEVLPPLPEQIMRAGNCYDLNCCYVATAMCCDACFTPELQENVHFGNPGNCVVCKEVVGYKPNLRVDANNCDVAHDACLATIDEAKRADFRAPSQVQNECDVCKNLIIDNSEAHVDPGFSKFVHEGCLDNVDEETREKYVSAEDWMIKCPVCLSDIHGEDAAMVKPCLHVTHKKCLGRLLDTGLPNCAECRGNIIVRRTQCGSP